MRQAKGNWQGLNDFRDSKLKYFCVASSSNSIIVTNTRMFMIEY